MSLKEPIEPAPLILAAPEEVGLSGPALDRIDAALGEHIRMGQLGGVVTLVARKGRLVHLHAQGKKNLATGEALKTNSIFRIYSMTKPVTGAAMMILYDRGLWRPEDSISEHLPEFKGVRVFAGLDADGRPVTVAADREPTVGELMTHTAGFTGGFMPDDPLDALYLGADLWKQPSLDAFSKVIAGLPLAYQPGTQWKYSLSMDLQGAMIERLSGQTLPDFMQAQLFDPLGMVDTGFFVPGEKRDRLSGLFRLSTSMGLADAAPVLRTNSDHLALPPVPAGGSGLVSTARDYARFAQMLLNLGELGGQRLIQPESVALMTRNHLSDELIRGGFGVGSQFLRPGFGYAFDCAVYYDPSLAGMPVGEGTFQWDGAAGTWFWVDPANELVFVGMIQLYNETASLRLQEMTQRLMAAAFL